MMAAAYHSALAEAQKLISETVGKALGVFEPAGERNRDQPGRKLLWADCCLVLGWLWFRSRQCIFCSSGRFE
jgi:hypothetical protein